MSGMKESCAYCGHYGTKCDIHNSSFVYGRSDSHGCIYYQPESAISEKRCGGCPALTSQNGTWGHCTMRKDLHKNSFACESFVEIKEEPMSTYHTKCGRTFEKSTNAETTGYHLEEDEFGNIFDLECAACPFPIDVKEGWGVTESHKRWECRAGSLPPNHKNSYGGSVDDKCTLHIFSLDHEFCESVITFARNHPDLSASYNQDCSDCRRTVSVSCSQNKAGMAAKKELIEKFFPPQEAPEPRVESEADWICGNCVNYDPTGKDIGTCELTNKPVSRVRPSTGCEDFDQDAFDDEEEFASLDLEDQIDVLLDKADKFIEKVANGRRCGSCSAGHWYSGESTYTNVVQDDGVHTVKRLCKPHTHYCYQFAEGQREIAEDKDFDPDTSPVWCPIGEVAPPTPEPKKQPRTGSQGCQEMREDCPCFCAHNDGCAVLLATGGALKAYVDQFTRDGGVDCDVFRKVAERVSETQESVNKTTEIVTEQPDSVPDVIKPVEVVPTSAFDYSEVDHETADFLQEKANRITEIRIKSVIAIGRELKETQDRLANHGNGTFERWYGSIGLKKDAVYRDIRAYEWILANCEDPELAENIQPSLLFEVSKPSAPPELQQAVIDGDITKHKDYVEALEKIKKLNKTESELRELASSLGDEKTMLEQELAEAKKASKEWHSAYETQRAANREQRSNSDPENVQRLVNQQVEANRKIFSLEQEIEKLNEQLNAKPIEATAVEIREVIPEDIGEAWCRGIENAIEILSGLTEKDMNRIIRILGRENYHYMKSGSFWQHTIEASGFLEDLVRSIRSLPAPADEFNKWLEVQDLTS